MQLLLSFIEIHRNELSEVADVAPYAPVREYAYSHTGAAKTYAAIYLLDEPSSNPVPLTRAALSAGK